MALDRRGCKTTSGGNDIPRSVCLAFIARSAARSSVTDDDDADGTLEFVGHDTYAGRRRPRVAIDADREAVDARRDRERCLPLVGTGTGEWHRLPRGDVPAQ